MKSSVTIALVPSIKTGPWIYWNDLEGSLQKASDLGFDAVELFTSSADAINIRTLKDSVTRLELSVSAVGTGAGKVEKGLTLTDPDPAIREKATDFISDMIAFGAAFGAPAIIGSMQGNVFPGVEKKQALDWLAEGLSILGKRAEEAGVPLIYEPLNRYETNLINDLSTGVAFIEALDNRNIALLADLFHMNIEEASIADSIRETGHHIGHVHLADSNRRPGGMGHTRFEEIASALSEIGYSGYLSAEAFPYPTPDEAAHQTIRTFKTFFK